MPYIYPNISPACPLKAGCRAQNVCVCVCVCGGGGGGGGGGGRIRYHSLPQ